MKELNRMLSGYLERVKRTHRYLAILVVLSLVVTFVVPLGLIENADSKTGQLICGMIEHTHNAECDYGTNCTITPHIHTEACYQQAAALLSAAGTTTTEKLTNAAGEDGNIVGETTYSPKEAELLTLLFGKNSDGTSLAWLKDATTLDEALSAAEDEYFLGMASDFCAFIEGDFIPTEADAEGRVAVGGDLMFKQTGSNIWNYQIASGDYQSMTPIQDTGPYKGITGFASALVGGKMYRINTLSTGNKSKVAGTLVAGHTSGDTVYYTPEVGGFKSFVVGNITASRHWDGDNSQDIAYSTGCHHDYPSDCAICASNSSDHQYLANVNELAQMYEYTDVRQVITKVFSEVRNRSQALSQVSSTPGVVNGNTVTFTYTGSEDADTVYFAVDSWDGAWNGVEFVNIPTKDGIPVNIIVNCGGNVVNLHGDGNNFATTINGTSIHNIANNNENNHKWSSCLLYNFYEATEMTLNGNFNGTVLAPNADVKSDTDTCSGHLSGALIAKSFYGGLEFGYRPYRGGSNILGLVSGYAAPVDKLDGDNKFLSGAELKVEQSLDNGSTFQTFMEHITDNNTWWIPFQSLIDYSGKTDYQPKINGDDTMTIEATQTLTISNGSGTIDLQGGNWSSSAEEIATVDGNGKVTAIGAGDVAITFTIGGKTLTKDIKVNYKPLELSGLPSELYESQTIDLSGKASSGSGNYEWSITSGGDAASISGTTFTAKDVSGDTTVTLCVKDTKAEETKEHQITVKPLGMTGSSSMSPSDSQTLTITVPAGITYNVASSNTSVATVTKADDGTVTVNALATGTTTISLWVDGTSYVSFELTVDTAPVTISNMPSTMYEGETIDLSDKASGGSGSFTWSVETAVATITDNKLYANANIDTATEVNLTVTDVDGKTADCKVTITPLQITTSGAMVIGREYDLTLNSGKQANYDWTSDSESVTISGTKATANSAATGVTISVRKDGVTYATLTVDVSEPSEQLQFSSDLPDAVFEGETISLEGMLTGGSGSLKWTSSNESFAKVDGNTIITYNVDSDTDVTITVTDENDSTNTATYGFKIKAVSITATNDKITVNGSPDTTKLTIIKGDSHTLTSSDTNGDYVTFDEATSTATAKAAGSVTYSLVLNGVTYASVTITVKPEAGTVQLPITVAKGETQEIPFDTSKIPISIELNASRLGDTNWWSAFYVYVYEADKVCFNSSQVDVNNGTLQVSWTLGSEVKPTRIEVVSHGSSHGSFTINSYTITYADGTTETYTAATQATSLAARAKGIRRAVSRSTEESMTQTFTQLYRITEVTPPAGYFGDDTKYFVKVTETIDLTQLKTDADSCFPMSTVTKMEFCKKTIEGGTESETVLYTVDLEISDDYGDKKTNTRTVTIGSDTFVMTVDSDQGIITALRVNGTDQTGISFTESSILTVGDNKYRFDPAHMMVVPVPAETQVQFINQPGVLFKKVDDVNEPLTKATIQMSQLVGEDWTEVDETVFDADAVESGGSTMLKLDTYLATAGEYIFKLEETETPKGYQTAAPIYFKIVVAEDLTATYSISSDNENWTTLEKQNGYYTISMVDEPLYGIKLSLQKIDGADAKITLQGAQFALYAADHTLVYPTDYPGSNDHLITTGEDGTIDLSTLFEANPTLADSQYVREGFLKAGSYYFKEITPPTRTDSEGNTIEYALPNQTFAFTVKKKTDDTYELKVETPITEHGYTTVNENQALLITAAGLANVTDEMITNGDTILTITYDTSASQQVNEHWGNAKFSGLYGTDTKTSDDVKIYSASETVSLTARQMLEKLGISYTDDTLIAEFRKLNQFTFVVWNSTTITTYNYLDTANAYPKSPEAYDLTKIGWSVDGDGKPTVEITELTLYYLNGTTTTVTNVGYTSYAQWWAPLDLSGFPSLDNVVGAKLVAGGSGTNNIQFKISDSESVWGNDEWGNISISGGQTYTFGDTSGTAYVVDESVVDESDEAVVQIANDQLKDKMDFSVEKHWVGDSDFLTMRPESIQVQLYRTTDPDNTTGAESVGEAVTLTATDNWTYLWKELPRQSDADDNYYYFVKEVEDATLLSRYTVDDSDSKPSNLGGVYVITNTLKTEELSVTKTWDASGYKNVDTPDILRLQLQWNLGTDEKPDWQNVPGKILILRKASGWVGKFENLPVGHQYCVVELKLPYGWTMTGNSETDQKISLTNTFQIEQGSLSVSKNWENDSGDDRPESITLNLYQSVTAQSGTYSDMPYGDDPESVQNDYARLLQYSLYFYDANMCGKKAQQNSAVSWRGNCHIEDEVQGGYHDAGDHVMFGLAQGYAASTLGWGYYAFEEGYKNLGQDKHYEIIMKQFCDFFMDATKLDDSNNVVRMLYQKGNGDIDHTYWGAPENQDDRSSQMYWTTNGASDVAAEYAAALALGYLTLPDAPNRDDYLKYAKALFAFSTKYNQKVGAEHTGFYNSDSVNDDQAWAAGWLCLAEGNTESNKAYYNTWLNAAGDPWCHCWNNVNVGAAYLQGVVNNNWDKMERYLGITDNNDYYYADAWGSARYNAAGQLAALTTAKALEDSDNAFATKCYTWAQGQMDMLLGNNTWNGGKSVCLVTGFAPNSAQWAHHRAASGYDSDAEFEKESTYDDDGHVLIGGLVGGPAFKAHTDQSSQLSGYPELMKSHEYIDHVQDYCCNEVSIDYNAGLVGAAAGLYSFYETGELSTTIEGIETVYLPKDYDGGKSSSSSSSSSSSTSEPSSVSAATAAPEGYTVPSGYYLAAYTSQKIKNGIDLTGEALNIVGVEISQIDFKFKYDGGNFNGQISINEESKFVYHTENKDSPTFKLWETKEWTYKFDSPTIIESLKINSWYCEPDVQLEMYFLVKIDKPTIVGAPQTLAKDSTATLTAVGFTSTDGIAWSSSDSSILSVDNGTVTATGYGKATITASKDGKQATATIEVKPPLSIDKTDLSSGEGEKLTTATLTSVAGVTYTVDPKDIVTIDESGKVTPVEGANGTVTIYAAINGATSEAVQVTVRPPLGGTSDIINTNSRKDMDDLVAKSLVGLATWAVKESEDYTITKNKSGTVITVTKGDDKLLTLSTKTGVVCTYDAVGEVTLIVTDSANGLRGEVELTVKQAGYIAEIPALRINLIGTITLTATGATLDLIDGTGMNTNNITLSKASETAAWSAVLENLCQYDEMGNAYYYYIEEAYVNDSAVENGSFTSGGTQYMVSGYSNNGTMLNATSAASISVTNKGAGEVQRPLPSAGGEGKANIYVVGVFLMLLSSAGIIGLKRRQGSPRHR